MFICNQFFKRSFQLERILIITYIKLAITYSIDQKEKHKSYTFKSRNQSENYLAKIFTELLLWENM